MSPDSYRLLLARPHRTGDLRQQSPPCRAAEWLELSTSATSHQQWQIVPYQGLDGLQQLKEDWERLYHDLPFQSAFHSFAAMDAYVRHLCPDPQSFACFALTDGQAVRAICALERSTQRLFGMRVPVWKSCRHAHWAIADAICPEGEPRQHLLRCLLRHLHRTPGTAPLLVLGPTADYSAFFDGLASLHQHEYCTDVLWHSSIVGCRRPFTEIEAGLTKRARQDRKRAHKRLQELENVEWVQATSGAALDREFESFLEVEASGWKGPQGTGTAVACIPELVPYYRDLIHGLSRTAECGIFSLYADGRCLGSQIGIRGRDECIALKAGYDETFSAIMPGKLVDEAMIVHCCEDAVSQRINFLTEIEWLRGWHADTVPVTQIHLSITRVRGRVLVTLFRLRGLLRTAAREYREHVSRNQRERARKKARRS